MSKSIKLKDNNYWDSTGIVHNKKLLSNILSDLYLKQVDIGGMITDKKTKTVTIEDDRTYLFINSHLYQLSMYIFQGYSTAGFKSVQICGENTGDITFKRNSATSVTITAGGQCRGRLYVFPPNIGTGSSE